MPNKPPSPAGRQFDIEDYDGNKKENNNYCELDVVGGGAGMDVIVKFLYLTNLQN